MCYLRAVRFRYIALSTEVTLLFEIELMFVQLSFSELAVGGAALPCQREGHLPRGPTSTSHDICTGHILLFQGTYVYMYVW